jgi:hypothetical protein
MSGPFRIGDRFAEERAVAGGLPQRPFDACIEHPAVTVDKYQTVTFDRNQYSVPRDYAFHIVAVKGYVDRVVIVAGGQVVASHPRHYERCAPVLDPHHYLVALGRRPAALDHAPVFRDWDLPPRFGALRAALEGRHGDRAGSRHYIRVLQLLNAHPQARVERAIEAGAGALTAEAIIQRVRAPAAAEALQHDTKEYQCESMMGPGVEVPAPDLGRFNRLLDDPRPGPASPGKENMRINT